MLLLFAATYDVLGTFPSAVSRMKLQLQLFTHVLQFFFLRYPITAKTSSNWMVLFAIGSYLNYCELEIASIARQTRRVEQSSDRQVVLFGHRITHGHGHRHGFTNGLILHMEYFRVRTDTAHAHG